MGLLLTGLRYNRYQESKLISILYMECKVSRHQVTEPQSKYPVLHYTIAGWFGNIENVAKNSKALRK